MFGPYPTQAATQSILHDGYGLDAAHMKHRKYNGQLLLLTARDGCNHNLVLAAGLVPTEDYDNYAWFLQCVKQSAGVTDVLNRPESVMVSDRDKGIAGALDAELPLLHKTHCFKHILRNYKTHAAKHKHPQLGLHETLAWKACKAESMAEFEAAMTALANVNAGI